MIEPAKSGELSIMRYAAFSIQARNSAIEYIYFNTFYIQRLRLQLLYTRAILLLKLGRAIAQVPTPSILAWLSPSQQRKSFLLKAIHDSYAVHGRPTCKQ